MGKRIRPEALETFLALLGLVVFGLPFFYLAFGNWNEPVAKVIAHAVATGVFGILFLILLACNIIRLMLWVGILKPWYSGGSTSFWHPLRPWNGSDPRLENSPIVNPEERSGVRRVR